MKKLSLATLVLALLVVLGMGTQASAMITGDLGAYGTLVTLPLTPPTIIDVNAFGGGLATQGSVDFAVLFDSSTNIYTYFYQVENIGGGLDAVLGRITIDNPWNLSLIDSGIMDDELDPVELFFTGPTFGANLDEDGDFLTIGEGNLTNRFFFQFSAPPGITYAYLIDGGIGSGKVIGPMIPEPTTMLLFGTGMLGLLGLRRKKS